MRKLTILSLFLFSGLMGFAQVGYTIHTLAGDTAGYFNSTDTGGYRNGTNNTALFNGPAGIAADTSGTIVYVADYGNNRIRKITGTATSTFAGDTAGFKDGSDSLALFNGPVGICTDSAGNVYVADTRNNAIREISSLGVVTTIGGKGPDSAGYRDGTAANALFNLPFGVAVDKAGNLYVADYGNNVVREISAGIVYTLAGKNDSAGYRNGADTSAEFNGLNGIAVDDSGNVYVTESINNAVREIRQGFVFNIGGFDTVGMDTTILTNFPGYQNGGADTSKFSGPAGIVVDKSGAVYVSDQYNNVIRKIQNGTVTAYFGNGIAGLVNRSFDSAEFYQPFGIAIDKHGDFYITDEGNNVVREIYPPGVTGIPAITNEQNHLLGYPNPCNANITMVSSQNGVAELLDLTGRVIWSDEHFKSPYILATANISPGVYFFRVSTLTQTAVSKIVVTR